MHLVIYFCGTGNPGDEFPDQFDYAPKEGTVRKIFVKGCEQPEVCNSAFFPNLRDFASRFTKKLFGTDKRLATTQSTDLASIGIRLDRSDIEETNGEEIESIILCGYSRGAVTCFEIAKELNKIDPRIPIDIVANQPVPGNSCSIPGSNVANVSDCTQLANLRNVSIILGAYTGADTYVKLYVKLMMPEDFTRYKHSYLLVSSQLYYVGADGHIKEVPFNFPYSDEKIQQSLRINPTVTGSYSIFTSIMRGITAHYAAEAQRQSESTNPFHRLFFSQVVPKFRESVCRELIMIPRESHHYNPANTPDGSQHMHMQVAKYLHQKGLISVEDLQRKIEEARATYSRAREIKSKPFPLLSKLQGFFGLKAEEAYGYVDVLHPETHLSAKRM